MRKSAAWWTNSRKPPGQRFSTAKRAGVLITDYLSQGIET